MTQIDLFVLALWITYTRQKVPGEVNDVPLAVIRPGWSAFLAINVGGLKSQNQSRFPADSHLKSSISEMKDRGGGKGVHFLNGLFKTCTKLNVFSL